jgi:hypothetical protein
MEGEIQSTPLAVCETAAGTAFIGTGSAQLLQRPTMLAPSPIAAKRSTSPELPSSIAKGHALPHTRQSGKHTHSPIFALEEHDQLVRRLEAGIQHRDEMMAKERERHRVEMASLSKRLLDAEEREAAMQRELLSAKQDSMALNAAHRRIAEMTRTNDSAAHKLTSLSDAASLDQEKHTVVSKKLEAERRAGASLRAEIEALRAEIARSTVRTAVSEAALKQLEVARATEVGNLEAQLQAQLMAAMAAKGHALSRVAQRLLNQDIFYSLNRWAEWAVKTRKVLGTLVLARRKVHRCWLGAGFQAWLLQTQISIRLKAVLELVRPSDGAKLDRAWSKWKAHAHQAMRRLLRHKRSMLNLDVVAVTQELQELQASCHAQQVSLTESLDLIRTLELVHREEHGRMEAEIVSLNDRLKAKRESCEKLRRVNTHIIRQFEAAEADFAAVEQRRKEVASSSMVGRVIDAVFGSESPALSANKVQRRTHPEMLSPLIGSSSGSAPGHGPDQLRRVAIGREMSPSSTWEGRDDVTSPSKQSSPDRMAYGSAIGRWGSRSPRPIASLTAPSQRKQRMHTIGTAKPPRRRSDHTPASRH